MGKYLLLSLHHSLQLYPKGRNQSTLHIPSYLAASNIDSLRSTDITFVLTIMSSDLSAPTLQEHLDMGIVTARFNKDDKPAEDMLSIFGSTCDLIEEKRAEGKKVLVHCRMGISRSVTLVMAYRMSRSPRPVRST